MSVAGSVMQPKCDVKKLADFCALQRFHEKNAFPTQIRLTCAYLASRFAILIVHNDGV